MESKKVKYLLLAIIVGLSFIGYFVWSEVRTGSFQWWHLYALLGVTLIGILSNLVTGIQKIINPIINYFKWSEEILVRKEFLMAVVPLNIIISSYLMQSALKDNQIDKVIAILSCLMLAFSVFLFAVAFFRVRESLVRFAYEAAASLAVIGSMVFAIEWAKSNGELLHLGASKYFVTVFSFFGLVVILGIMAFFLIRVINSDNRQLKKK